MIFIHFRISQDGQYFIQTLAIKLSDLFCHTILRQRTCNCLLHYMPIVLNRNYCTNRQCLQQVKHEVFSIVIAKELLLLTDHPFLTWFIKFKNPKCQITQYILKEYKIYKRHCKGTVHRLINEKALHEQLQIQFHCRVEIVTNSMTCQVRITNIEARSIKG